LGCRLNRSMQHMHYPLKADVMIRCSPPGQRLEQIIGTNGFGHMVVHSGVKAFFSIFDRGVGLYGG